MPNHLTRGSIRRAAPRRRCAWFWIAAVFWSLLLASAQPRAQGLYQVVPFPSPEGLTLALVADLNNQRQGVGLGRDRDTLDPRAYFADERGARTLPVDNPESIVINNRGMIAGTRRVGGNDQAARMAFLSDGPALDTYTEVPFPPGLFLFARRLTDNGILLLSGNTSNSVTYAIYQHRLIPLPEFDAAVDINELATVVGVDRQERPLIRYVDGRLVTPWSGDGVVTAIGASGHFAGHNARGSTVLWYGEPGGAVSRLPLGGSVVFPKRINRGGAVAGDYDPNGPGDRYAFLLADGVFQNVNALVDSPGVYFRQVVALTDDGVLAVQGGGPPANGSGGVVGSFLLIPPVGARPVVSYLVAGSMVTLTWSSVPNAFDYIIAAGSGPGLEDRYLASVGPVLGVSGNVPPGRYYVRVRARTASGLGPPSSEVIVDVP